MDPEQRPIGWWVKRLGTLLDEAVDAVVAGEELTRQHVVDGLSRQEYERTVLVLSRMVGNVERALGRG
ncbi:hypothetical protein GCU60_15910 [Blastococcus saxobsidens]|uniref:MarR family transcriptional regulator n=1 Tax=Blastococcus saxobsidens TaxID=138336 RepID=A0A6L9W5C2_9ACTN|nr:hypothetical protein [Blastococcus saxobsidens]NEK87227.1 hypothetical protein [Blastococcus saxobsidens]